MSIPLYADVHVDRAIVDQLRLRNVEVLTTQEDGSDRLIDELLLERASALGRPIFTHDVRFHVLPENWQRQGRQFCGLIFAHLMQVSIGQCVRDLDLIANATDPEDWTSAVVRLPL
jgi:hypothetical protein